MCELGRLLHGRRIDCAWSGVRPAQHEDCDVAEVCTGKMSDCPVDLYKSPGTDCTEKIFPDDSEAKSNEDGKCYRGECISQAGSCIDPNTGGAIYDGSTPHTSYCDRRLGTAA